MINNVVTWFCNVRNMPACFALPSCVSTGLKKDCVQEICYDLIMVISVVFLIGLRSCGLW